MYHIRPAKEEDFEVIHAIHMSAIQELCTQSYSDEEIKQWTNGQKPARYLRHIKDPKHHIYVVEFDGEIAGFGHLAKSSDEAYEKDREMEIKALYVSPQNTAQGIGTRLYLFLENLAKEMECKKLIVKSSLNAIGFYESKGFFELEKV